MDSEKSILSSKCDVFTYFDLFWTRLGDHSVVACALGPSACEAGLRYANLMAVALFFSRYGSRIRCKRPC